MAEVEIVPKPQWRTILTVTAAPGPSPPAGTAILTLDGPHGLTDDDGVWVSGLSGISGVSEISEQAITVIDPTTVSLDGTSISGTYGGGGVFRDASQNRHRINNSNNRPLQSGGPLYFTVYYIPSTQRTVTVSEAQRISVYKSTDSGATWVRQDSGTEQSLSGNTDFGVAIDGSTEWHSYKNGSVVVGSRVWDVLRLRPFNVVSNTWGALSPDGPKMDPPQPTSFPVVMADGRLFVYYEHSELRPGSASLDEKRPAWAIYDPVGNVWDSVDNYFAKPNNTIIDVVAGSPNSVQTATAHGYQTGDTILIAGTSGVTNVNGTRIITVTGPATFTTGSSGTGTYGGGGTTHFADDVRANGLAIGDGGRIHLFYGSDNNSSGTSFQPANLYQRTFDTTSLTLAGDEQLITAEMSARFAGYGVPLAYTSGATRKLIIPISHQANTGGAGTADKVQVAEADDALNPVWSITDVSATNKPYGSAQFCWADVAYDPATDKLWLFWTSPQDPDGKTNIVYNTKTAGGAWGADVTWKTHSEYWYADPAPAIIGGQVTVIYTKVHPNEIGTGESIGTELERFPHIDVVSVCPPSVVANYAFFY